MIEKNRDEVGIRIIGVISTGTKVISFIGHYQMMRIVQRNMRNAKHAYRLGWTLLIMKIVCVILEYSILAAFLIFMKVSDLVIIGWTIGLTLYHTVLSIVLHVVIEYAFEPLKAYIVELDSKFLPLQPVNSHRAPPGQPEAATVSGEDA
ncbi:hypothetical protein GCK72_009565 [Caenorhabditis remanei]|uniref:Uncharacterized protein n=2 Tax=Caenorhabditis remanei TaxID=31234 RepID=A0A6A5H2V2_CAERE|nr:hypothetical protein GCK72_009565 [Caenorhabditis remanei]KAF1761309.1 hypothetical protein GCK72_009565 [Caenorhabditis remanei]